MKLKKLIIAYSVLGVLLIILAIIGISNLMKSSKKDLNTYSTVGKYSTIIDHVGTDSEDDSGVNQNFTVLYLNYADISRFDCIAKDGKSTTINVNHIDDNNFDLVLTSATDPDLEYSQTSMKSYLGILADYNAITSVKNPAALSEYGLDNPAYTVVITLVDGTSKKVFLGDKTPEAVYSGGVYFSVEGVEGVFITSSIKLMYCAYDDIDFFSSYKFGITQSDVTTVEFIRNYSNNDVENCSFTAEASLSDGGDPIYSVSAPYNIQASSYFSNLVEKFVNLEITSFLDINEEDLADYGLDNPTYVFKMTLKSGEVISVYLSAPKDDFIYGYCTGLSHYFRLSIMQLEGIDTPVLTLLSKYISYYNVSDLTCIKCTYGDKFFKYDLDVKESTSISATTSIAKLNNRDARVWNSQGKSYAALLFEALVSVNIGGIEVDAVVEDNPEISLTFNTRNYDTRKVDFVKRDDSTYYVFINDVYTNFYVNSKEIFKDGGDSTYNNYGFWSIYELTETAISNQIDGVYDPE